jgi:hypothetical protein
MTFMNESFFHVLRKWGTKHSHFARYYSIAIWCTLLHWNENVTRAFFGYEWKASKSGQLKASAGRFYRTPIRPPQTDEWRSEGWRRYLAWARQTPAPVSQPVESFYLGWEGPDPPQQTRILEAQAAAPAEPAPTKAVEDMLTGAPPSHTPWDPQAPPSHTAQLCTLSHPVGPPACPQTS